MGHDCGKHDNHCCSWPFKCKPKKLFKLIFWGVAAVLLAVLIIIFLIWVILSPSQPQFTIQDATVYAFNVSTNPNLLTSNLQLTIASRNPNDKVGVYYDRLDVYAAYRNQQITMPYRLPTDYQGPNEVNVWSPFIYGNLVPIAPYNALALAQDQNLQAVELNIKINGRVKFKVGSFISGKYHLYVNCPALITFGSRSTGVVMGDAVKYQIVQRCSVSV